MPTSNTSFKNPGFLHKPLQHILKWGVRNDPVIQIWHSYLPRNSCMKAWRNFSEKTRELLQGISLSLGLKKLTALKILWINSRHFHGLTGTHSAEPESQSRWFPGVLRRISAWVGSENWVTAESQLPAGQGNCLTPARSPSREGSLTNSYSHFLSEPSSPREKGQGRV